MTRVWFTHVLLSLVGVPLSLRLLFLLLLRRGDEMQHLNGVLEEVLCSGKKRREDSIKCFREVILLQLYIAINYNATKNIFQAINFLI